MAEVLSILFFGAIAVFFAFRLYTLLGRSEGHMEPPQPRDADRAGQSGDADQPVLRAAYEGPAAAGLEAIAAADRRFDPLEFTKGARAAYEMIVMAFAKGDRATLAGLLSPSVLKRYEKALDDREAAGHTVQTEIERIKSSDIAEAELRQGMARVKVRFDVELATETRDSEGKRVAGDFGTLSKSKEYWTFERDTTNSDPNWVLASVSVA